MKVEITTKIQNEKGEELILTEEEVRVLYLKLRNLFERSELITIPTIPYYPSNPWKPLEGDFPIISYGNGTCDCKQ